jgi:RND superfamily putative drug exporter
MGLAAAATVVVAVLVAVTLVPAVLGLLGLRVLPRRQREARPALTRSWRPSWPRACSHAGPDAVRAPGRPFGSSPRSWR